MNKYQEALDCIKEIVIDEHADGYYQPRTVGQYYHEAIDDLKELVDKSTPKKPNDLKIYYFDIDYEDEEPVYECTTGKCPSCNCILEHHYNDVAYCPRCGQRIDWSEEDD